ncbi:MAG: MarR family winged helix-turn-helix transcriptional regulator [Gammaproteobacteria bacterium]
MKDYEDLLIALRRITRAIDLHSKRLQKESGLTASQLLVIEAIEKLNDPTPSSIAREILLSQGTVTNLIDRMERNGLVRRVKSASDKRSVGLVTTPEGLERYQNAPELLQEEFLTEFRKLESWEQHHLLSAVERVASMMDASGLDASPILVSGEIGTISSGEP